MPWLSRLGGLVELATTAEWVFGQGGKGEEEEGEERRGNKAFSMRCVNKTWGQ